MAAAVRRLDGGPGPPEEVALIVPRAVPAVARGIRSSAAGRTVPDAHLLRRPARRVLGTRRPSSAATSGSGLPISDAVLQRQWTGAWIACPGAPERDPGVFRFRKSIDLAGRSAPLRRPRERRPALRPARERPSRRRRPVARRHPLLALRDVRPRALPEAGAEPRLGHRLELRDAGARGADHRPDRLRRAGRRRGGAAREHRRLLGVRAGAGPPAVARGPEAAPRGGAPVPRRGPGRTARRRAVRLERGGAPRPGSARRPLEAGRRLGARHAPLHRRGPRLPADARRPAARPRRAAADGVPPGRRGGRGEGRGRRRRGLPGERARPASRRTRRPRSSSIGRRS